MFSSYILSYNFGHNFGSFWLHCSVSVGHLKLCLIWRKILNINYPHLHNSTIQFGFKLIFLKIINLHCAKKFDSINFLLFFCCQYFKNTFITFWYIELIKCLKEPAHRGSGRRAWWAKKQSKVAGLFFAESWVRNTKEQNNKYELKKKIKKNE